MGISGIHSRLVLQHQPSFLLCTPVLHQWLHKHREIYDRVPAVWNPATGFGMPPEYMMPSSAGQPSSSASQPMNQQVNASVSQPTQSQDAAPAPQPSVTPASAPSPASPNNMSAPWLTPQQQNLPMILQPKSPTEVLANRIPHANGVT